MSIGKMLFLQQINDSQFPIGGYSHSYGFETYVQERSVDSEEEARDYVLGFLQASFLYTDLFSAYLAYGYGQSGDLEGVRDLNGKIRISKVQRELREASEKLGSRLAKTVMQMEISWDLDFFSQVIEDHRREKLPLHHSVAYGLIMGESDIDLDQALAAYCLSVATTMTTNAVKTIPISQMSGQRILYQAQGLIGDLVKRVKELEEEDFGLSFPGVELSSMRHENLYSRLYMS